MPYPTAPATPAPALFDVTTLTASDPAGTLVRVALDELERVLPHAARMTLDGLTHEGPEDDGHPVLVAGVLRDFFAGP